MRIWVLWNWVFSLKFFSSNLEIFSWFFFFGIWKFSRNFSSTFGIFCGSGFSEIRYFPWFFFIKYGFFADPDFENMIFFSEFFYRIWNYYWPGIFRNWNFSLNIFYGFALFFLILISWSMIFFSEYVSIEFGIFCGSGFFRIWYFSLNYFSSNLEFFGILLLEFEYLDFWLMFRHDFNGRLLKSIRRMFSVARYKFKATQVGRILKFDQDVIPRLGYQTPIKSFASVRSTQTVLFVMLDFGLKRRWRVSVRGEKTDFAKLFVFQLLYFALQAWMGANVLE